MPSIATELAKATLPLMSAMAPIATELMRHTEPSLSAKSGITPKPGCQSQCDRLNR